MQTSCRTAHAGSMRCLAAAPSTRQQPAWGHTAVGRAASQQQRHQQAHAQLNSSPSGLQWVDLREGDGPSPAPSSSVRCGNALSSASHGTVHSCRHRIGCWQETGCYAVLAKEQCATHVLPLSHCPANEHYTAFTLFKATLPLILVSLPLSVAHFQMRIRREAGEQWPGV